MRFEQTIHQIEALVADEVVPGVSYAVIEGQQVTTKVLGYSELTPKLIPLEPGQLYDLASLTKVIGTTTLILRLLERGRLSLTT